MRAILFRVLTIFRRHLKSCKFAHKGRKHRHCNCPIAVEGRLRGEMIRRSLDIRSWDAAQKVVREWEANGPKKSTTINGATKAWLSDCEARNLKPQTMKKYRQVAKELNNAWNGATLRSLDVNDVRKLREGWKLSGQSAAKRLELVRGFFNFCIGSDWLEKNPAKGVKNPTPKAAPTLPFSDEEWKNILTALDVYREIHPQSPEIVQKKLRALILLMRYSGLRISDAVSLKRERINKDGRLFLYTQKTGKPVNLKLPPFVIRAIDAADDGELFWNFRGTLKSRLTEWQERLKKIANIAGIEGRGFAHRLRDSFSVDLLNHGTPVEMVAILLGNTTAVVQKHYSPWVQSRQIALDKALEMIWK